MVDRASAPADFNTGRGPSIQGTQIGDARADRGKFSTEGRGFDVQTRGLDNLLETITNATGKLASKQMEVSQQEAYLRGAAKAGMGEEEDSLNENIFTRNWATAGWRDTTGKLAAADAEAQTAVDMKQLREQSPEKFQEYLAQRRTKLLPQTEGMSFEARKGMLAQQLTSERAAIKQHGMAHAQWIIDQQTKAIQTSTSVSFDGLDAVKASAPAYKAGVESAFANVYSNVWLNPNLPEDMRIKLAGEAMSGALARDHQQLYEKFKTTPVKTADGKDATMFSQLPFDEQVKLSGDYRASRTRTETARSGKWETQSALMQASWEDPSKPMQPYSDLQSFLDEGEQSGLLKPGKRESMIESWAKANQKKVAASGIAQAYQAGDVQAIFNSGKDEGEAFQGWLHTKSMANTPLPQVIGEALSIGQNHGFQSAFKGVGDLTKSAVQQLGAEGPGSATNVNMLKEVLKTIHTAELKGRTGAMASYISGFDDDAKAKVLGYDERIRRGIDPVTASQEVYQIQIESAKLDPTTRNALAASNSKADAEAVAGIEVKQIVATMGSDVASWFSADAKGRKALSTGRAWFEEESRVEAVIAPSKAALLQELQDQSRANPYSSAGARLTIALANVSARTVQTDSGPLVLPKLPAGVTIPAFFGLAADDPTMPSTIGRAISREFPLQDKANRMTYNTFNGQLRITEFNAKGATVWTKTIDPRIMAGPIDAENKRLTDKYNATEGAGVTMKGSNGTPITFNGSTTTSIDPVKMLEFRKTLIRDEDVKAIPYPDLSGRINRKTKKPIMTVGAGISDTNTYYPKPGPDGSISQKDINESFMKATDEAARGAQQVFRGYPNANRRLEMIMLTLAYQSGPSFHTGPKAKAGLLDDPSGRAYDAVGIPIFTGNYGDFINSAIRGDKQAAIVALKGSPAYRASGESRRKHYLDMLNNAME